MRPIFVEMKAVDMVLAPLSWLYGVAVGVRNALYDYGLFREVCFPVTIISVGNLAVGGTGKTPHVIRFARLLHERGKRVAVLSRGYRRRSRGFRLVSEGSKPREAGDEPLEMRRKLPADVLIAVDRDRVNGVRELLRTEPHLDVILLDDGLQHRRLRRDLDIVLTDYSRPYSADHLLPWGRLREPVKGASRARVVIVTKTPQGTAETQEWRERLHLEPEQQLYFSTLKYDLSELGEARRVLLVCGIANPRPLIQELERRGLEVEPLLFGDHHNFGTRDLRRIRSRAQGVDCVVTTAKDAARLEGRLNARVVEIDVEVAGFNITDYVRED